ncbi:MAG: hypothetical protein ACRETL_00800, partial [Gammaproteobacteria bacterium]
YGGRYKIFNDMRKVMVCMACVLGLQVDAQNIDPVSLALTKLIRSADLKVQRVQNQVLRLVVAEQAAQRALSAAKLAAIAGWQEKLQTLYGRYFQELQTVRPAVSALPQVQEIRQLQAELLAIKDPRGAAASTTLVDLSKDALVSLAQVLGGQGLVLHDAERIQRILTIRDQMQGMLDQMAALQQSAARVGALQEGKKRDMQMLRKLNGQR